MQEFIIYLIIFAIGAIVGAIVMWYEKSHVITTLKNENLAVKNFSAKVSADLNNAKAAVKSIEYAAEKDINEVKATLSRIKL